MEDITIDIVLSDHKLIDKCLVSQGALCYDALIECIRLRKLLSEAMVAIDDAASWRNEVDWHDEKGGGSRHELSNEIVTRLREMLEKVKPEEYKKWLTS